MMEAEWTKTGFIPSLQEYMENGRLTIALEPIIFTSLFFVGPKLSEQMICHHEYKRLIKLVNTCGCLLNDIQSYKVLNISINKISPLYYLMNINELNYSYNKFQWRTKLLNYFRSRWSKESSTVYHCSWKNIQQRLLRMLVSGLDSLKMKTYKKY